MVLAASELADFAWKAGVGLVGPIAGFYGHRITKRVSQATANIDAVPEIIRRQDEQTAKLDEHSALLAGLVEQLRAAAVMAEVITDHIGKPLALLASDVHRLVERAASPRRTSDPPDKDFVDQRRT